MDPTVRTVRPGPYEGLAKEMKPELQELTMVTK
jgi:hypothetical protein